MSFNIYLTSSSKVENSTARFATTGLTPYACTLKDGCSISHPVVKIQIAFTSFANLTKNNVAYIANFRRYYFITDWRYEGVLAICTLSVDVLASFWDDLKTKSFYVTCQPIDQHLSAASLAPVSQLNSTCQHLDHRLSAA